SIASQGRNFLCLARFLWTGTNGMSKEIEVDGPSRQNSHVYDELPASDEGSKDITTIPSSLSTRASSLAPSESEVIEAPTDYMSYGLTRRCSSTNAMPA